MSAVRSARSFSVTVNQAYCKGCELCVRFCPKDVLAINEREKAVVVNLSDCTGCLLCEIYCPDFAIEVREVSLSA